MIIVKVSKTKHGYKFTRENEENGVCITKEYNVWGLSFGFFGIKGLMGLYLDDIIEGVEL